MLTPREEIEKVTVDCYDEYEQLSAWEVAFTDEVQQPFPAVVLGMSVEVSGFRVNQADILQCRVVREDKQRWISVEDLEEEGLPPDMAHLLTLYHAWQAGDY